MVTVTNNPLAPSFTTQTYQPDQLIVNGDIKTAQNAVIKTNAAVYKRGTVLGVITTGGAFQTALLASADGSQTPRAILLDDVDATGGDITGAAVALAGEFNKNSVILGTGITLAAATAALLANQIYLRDTVSAVDPT